MGRTDTEEYASWEQGNETGRKLAEEECQKKVALLKQRILEESYDSAYGDGISIKSLMKLIDEVFGGQ